MTASNTTRSVITAIALQLTGMVLFVLWLVTGDFLFGHFDGPWVFLYAACGLAAAGIAFQPISRLSRWRRREPRVGDPSWRERGLRIIAWLLWLPAAVILITGFLEWPKARLDGRRKQIMQHVINAQGPEAVPRLIQALEDPDYFIRMNAAGGLGKLGPDAGSAVPALIGAVQRDRTIAISAMWALAKIGVAARSAIPILNEVARDPERRRTEREIAASVSRQLGGNPVVLPAEQN